MVSHPNRKTPTRYHVTAYPGDLLGKFANGVSALRVAQMWSARWGSWAEVHYIGKSSRDEAAGLVGQFDRGKPTEEFAHLVRDIAGLDVSVSQLLKGPQPDA